MKKIILSLLFISSISFAQNGINYQGAATDADGAKLVNQNISLKTSVLQGGVDGTTSYSEIHNTTTDQFGLFNVVIGQGVSISGDFETISWGSGDHFLKVELDATGGTNYNLVSTTQMMSVPYALYAKNAGLDSAAVADMLASMNISSNHSGGCDHSFPDGIHNIEPVTILLWDNYIVPDGKTLYILNTRVANNQSIYFDDKQVIESSMYTYSPSQPLIAGSGTEVKHIGSGAPRFNGFLVNENVTAITHELSSDYTVPDGKILFILNARLGPNDYIYLDDVEIVGSGLTTYSFNQPLLAKSGTVVNDNNSGAPIFNGYLVDEDYFADCAGSGGSSTSTPSSVDSAMVADMIAANTSYSSGGDWELLYDELNTNNDEPYGTVNRYGIAHSDGFLYLLGSNVTVFTGNDHDTITNTWPENPLLQYITSSDPLEPNLIPLKKNMSWHLENNGL